MWFKSNLYQTELQITITMLQQTFSFIFLLPFLSGFFLLKSFLLSCPFLNTILSIIHSVNCDNRQRLSLIQTNCNKVALRVYRVKFYLGACYKRYMIHCFWRIHQINWNAILKSLIFTTNEREDADLHLYPLRSIQIVYKV